MEIKAGYLNVDNDLIDTQSSCAGVAFGLIFLVKTCMVSASWLAEVTTMPSLLAWVIVLTIGLTVIIPASMIFTLVVKWSLAILMWPMFYFAAWLKSLFIK